MSEKKYTNLVIKEVVVGPEIEGKFFSARCVIEGKDDPVRIRGFADTKKCIAAGKTIRASWSDEYNNYFTIGEARASSGSSSATSHTSATSARNFSQRFQDTREGFVLQQRCIAAQSAMNAAIQFLQGLPVERAAEGYVSDNAIRIARLFFESIWSSASGTAADGNSTKPSDAAELDIFDDAVVLDGAEDANQ